MNKHITVFCIKLCVVVGLFVLIFKPELLGFESLFGDVRPLDVWHALRTAGTTGPAVFMFWMACATLVKLAGITAGIIRWRLLLGGQGLRIPGLYLAHQWFMGRAIGLLLPGTLGLDGYRLVESSRYTREPVKCATVIAVEKLTGIIALSFLVFITFPLGFGFLQFNTVLLAGIMACLLGGVTGSLLLLLNPRVIQVMAAVLPAPPVARGLINKLGRAATAYGENKGVLMAALFFGVLVHLGTCSKYFFTFMAIRAANVSVTDILFVSPLMITASVLAFTISGLGVREAAFGLVLGGTAGHAVAILGGHLGLWAGEIVPFIISVPLLLFGGRPDKATLEKDRAYVAEHLARNQQEMSPLLTPEETRRYRRHVLVMLCCGAGAGLVAGTAIALLESFWIISILPGLDNFGLLPWGIIAYGALFAGLGFGVACGLLFLSLLFDRFPDWPAAVALCYAPVFAMGCLVIGMFRYQRDVLDGHAMAMHEQALAFAVACGLGLLMGVVAFIKMEGFKRYLRFTPSAFVGLALGAWLLTLAAAAIVAAIAGTTTPDIVFAPEKKNDGPNILLCTIDALRADYLRLYEPGAEAETPHLDALAEDSIRFAHAFSQSSWTKPSYGTIFTGLYPEGHGAATKTAVLSPDVETLAELLHQGGYYTMGFSNNPNMTRVFGMHRGFSNYVDLKPDLLFGAPASAQHLSMYNLLRKLFMTAEGLLRGGRLRITDFYQPAEVITRITLDWLDSREAPPDAPFYLYIHYMDTHDPFMDHRRPGVGYARARMEHPDPEQYLDPMRQAYVSEIEYLDAQLGRLFEGMKERGLYDNTIIVLLSDHGEEFYDHEGWWHGQTLYEEQLRVPLMIKLAENRHAGIVNEHMARLIDLPPTLLQLAGLPEAEAMDGQILCDMDTPYANATITYSYAENNFEGNVQQAVRTRERALILANEDNPRGVAPREFYNMEEDPAQLNNLAGHEDYAEDIAHLTGVIEQYIRMIRERAPEPTADVELDRQLQEQLEALGYL